MREVRLTAVFGRGFGGHFPPERLRSGQETGEMAAFCVKSVEIVGKLKRHGGCDVIKIAAKPATPCPAPSLRAKG
jgi:hypothetical protein